MNAEALNIGLPPANDRMLTTGFLAALLHAIVILGVTFSSQTHNETEKDAPALEVILVNADIPNEAKNTSAIYLSDHNQKGFGNTRQGDALIPKSSAIPAQSPGVPLGQSIADQQIGTHAGDDELVATHAPAVKVLYFASPNAAKDASQLPLLLENKPDLGMKANDDGIELRLRGDSKNQLWIAADTRESDVAVYLDSWRRKIERVGTLNFPDAVRRQKLSGTPVIDVTIGADGTLVQALIRRTSGHAEVDEAAMRILKLAAPFDPFPRGLNAQHDEIRIAYEWQFLSGVVQKSSVLH